jgi:2,3-bisphosphoglycerate-dependent phosphoglycerate mutase
VRHGQTAWNAEARFQGHTDVPLDAVGRAQAAALAAALHDQPFDAAVSSDLARARETAEAVIAGRGLPLGLDPRWREMAFGAWEGLTWSEIAARFPEAAGRPNEGGRFVTPTGGESFGALCARVRDAVADLGSRHPGRRVLVGTHAGPLHALLHLVLGASQAAALNTRFEPASLTRLRLSGGIATLLTLNETVPTDGGRFPGRSASAPSQSGRRG